MSSHYSRLQSKILVSECYLFILLEWSDDVTGYCAHVLRVLFINFDYNYCY